MSELPPDTRAARQMTYVMLTAFVVGFFGLLATLGWLIVHFMVPETRWWDILFCSINAIMISFIFGGLGLAALCGSMLSRFHYRRGVHRCPYCDRPLKGIGISCVCPESQALLRAG